MRDNSYVNAYVEGDFLYVIEKDKDGNRHIHKDYLDFVFYTLDEKGSHTTIFDELCTEHVYNSKKDFFRALKQYPKEKVYEHDVNHMFRYLSKNYDFNSLPTLNVVAYDIEVAFNPKTRYSNPDKAENEIITIAIYHQWSDRYFCLVLPPPHLSIKETERICQEQQKKYTNTELIVVKTEQELLRIFCMLIEEADVITGWNSEAYDFKYIVNRMAKILGEESVKWLSPISRSPVERTAYNEKIKNYYQVYEPVGLVHLDYQLLYKKYTYTELTSYSLDNVSFVELDDQKVDYDGNLYDLYLNDLATFIDYNLKDVELVDRLDKKLKFIELTNLLAHNNGVLMQTTLGTVALTEQAIINEGHYYFDKPVVFPSKPHKEENEAGAAGAFVVNPKVGIRQEVSGIDLESLYPSVIRCMNMSPETLVAHINSEYTDNTILNKVESGECESTTEAWHSFFNTLEFDEVINKTNNDVTLDFNRSDDSITVPAHKIYDLIFDNDDYVVTANGTIFSTKKVGVIPSLLTRWFMERRELKAKKEEWHDKLDGAKTEDEKAECNYWINFYDQRQLAKKINLNALYGALLNKHCRFYDKRIGQSTTLTGRSVTRHMASQMNYLITGEYSEKGKAIIYGDSVSGDTIISTSLGERTVEELFESCTRFWSEDTLGKEYGIRDDLKVKTYDPDKQVDYMGDINYIYRHKTRKEKWLIEDEYGNSVYVTGDHSIMVERGNVLVKVKPCDILEDDIVISV